MRLTVPVDGGAGVLKRMVGGDGDCSPPLFFLTTAKWRREHLGAWDTAYGRTPIFPASLPGTGSVYNSSEGGSLAGFSLRLHRIVMRWLGSPLSMMRTGAAPGRYDGV